MKPIIFSTPMVQAIMDGRKTMTRRVIKPQPAIMAKSKPLDGYSDSMIKAAGDFPTPKYKPGDVLWVRETFFEYKGRYHYKADDKHKALDTMLGSSFFKWHPSIHMPREAARLFLRVTSVRAERVQDISTSDCEREGIASDIDRFNGLMTPHHDWIVGEFSRLWDSLNAKRNDGEYVWDKSPWVWVVGFERIECPEK